MQIPCLHISGIELPIEFRRLYDMAYNYWWTWTPRARQLFAAIDSRAWAIYRNPLQMLINLDRSAWSGLREDSTFVQLYEDVAREFERYLDPATETWFRRAHPGHGEGPFAYFAMEFGLHQSLALYSGGLGVLCGDHLKSASDLGVPLVGVGLLYRHGYFMQNIDADGRQQHIYPEYDFSRLSVRPAAGHTGREVLVTVPFPGREVAAKVWVAQVGRVPLLLLDTDVSQNDPADRPIASILYTPGREMRLAQELLLGVGGVRALRALGIEPSVWHLNEGHSVLLVLERLRELVQHGGVPLGEAFDRVRRRTVFTTHTPVPAGNEQFEPQVARKYLEPWSALLGMPADELLALGNADHGEPSQNFNLTAMSVRASSYVNGVSRINAEVAGGMWRHLFVDGNSGAPGVEAITNGVHPTTWLGTEMQRLFNGRLGAGWRAEVDSPAFSEKLAGLPDEELWRTHQAQKARLARFARARLRDQQARHGVSPEELRSLEDRFDVDALTIGFARRFATYKRAALLFSDLHRLRALVCHPERPVQVVLAGKAHSADRAGQELIQHLYQLSCSPELKGRVFFLEDYDMRVGRMLVCGVDVWLNTPRPPLEASGTSGMKAAMNGALNCSIADGWWPEAADGDNGWVIDAGTRSDDEGQQDRDDALALYRLLEEEIVPRYYERDADGLPRGWIARMKQAMATITPAFSSHRMVRDYCDRAYVPAAQRT
ncbi:MAG: alpha-glucan family phosphorylase [Thermoanaerobaculia bacterium]|nr:alpha-glucan family phosphorylase [Thermoanaerobaculia bacterium]MCZ7650673.1 alpha-glucan family phosphorylase [Thermoanaerobaculia bacterium]